MSGPPVMLDLSLAWLCVECRTVTGEHKACPKCCSTQLLNLAAVLDRIPPSRRND